MPEGPSIVILKEEMNSFIGKKVLRVNGNTKEPVQQFAGQTITDLKSWGKHFLICFPTKTIRIHFLLFGSYRINDQKGTAPRLQFVFKNGEVNFYTCSVKIIGEDLDTVYDWEADVMNDAWKPRKARTKLKALPHEQAGDALLDQDIFAGVGNIIKNEVLFRIRVQPESLIGSLPAAKLSALIREARVYSFQFLEWKKAYTLKKHWKAHTKTICPRCHIPFIKKKTGRRNRRSFFCTNCQILYDD